MRKINLKDIQEVLNKNLSSYVLITCEHPSRHGDMQVEFSYQGDPALASYLLQDAQRLLEDEIEKEMTCTPSMSLIK